ncbi:SMI1/KNR4 family protein [Spiractinospora alimapuensis]|uniref:SMI1/KNR4 family protein n=1 Tax=Spiractinospora alimapuensis TaxID=2820884 RepID=UPI001F15B085|nr:SMI1/KNR4 family protein [Spiractinospora alimapuensis]QVQ53959.1 SMI1/KNR4 family protein [Spiractinospora alimapuensis]
MTELTFPPALADLAAHGRFAADFEMYEHFEAGEETAWWFRLWTGNDEVDGSEFRIFGMEGAGGYVGLWLLRPEVPLEAQPVVYLGSEGETAVLAVDLGSFLWLLAQGVGPIEATGRREAGADDPELVTIAQRHAPASRLSPTEILERARREFPHFESTIDAMCR